MTLICGVVSCHSERMTGNLEVIRFENDSLHLNVETLHGPEVALGEARRRRMRTQRRAPRCPFLDHSSLYVSDIATTRPKWRLEKLPKGPMSGEAELYPERLSSLLAPDFHGPLLTF